MEPNGSLLQKCSSGTFESLNEFRRQLITCAVGQKASDCTLLVTKQSVGGICDFRLRRGVYRIYVLGFYATYNGVLIPEDGSNRLSRNGSNKSSLLAAR
jgi:hypothetical protein